MNWSFYKRILGHYAGDLCLEHTSLNNLLAHRTWLDRLTN